MAILNSAMHKTTVVVDDRKLASARRILGTTGIRDTFDRALDEVIALGARRREIERLRTMRGMELDRPEVMRKAWR